MLRSVFSEFSELFVGLTLRAQEVSICAATLKYREVEIGNLHCYCLATIQQIPDYNISDFQLFFNLGTGMCVLEEPHSFKG